MDANNKMVPPTQPQNGRTRRWRKPHSPYSRVIKPLEPRRIFSSGDASTSPHGTHHPFTFGRDSKLGYETTTSKSADPAPTLNPSHYPECSGLTKVEKRAYDNIKEIYEQHKHTFDYPCQQTWFQLVPITKFPPGTGLISEHPIFLRVQARMGYITWGHMIMLRELFSLPVLQESPIWKTFEIAFPHSNFSKNSYNEDKKQTGAKLVGGSANPQPSLFRPHPKCIKIAPVNPFAGSSSNIPGFGSDPSSWSRKLDADAPIPGSDSRLKAPPTEQEITRGTKAPKTTPSKEQELGEPSKEKIDADLDVLCRPAKRAKHGPTMEQLSRLTADVKTLNENLKRLREENEHLRDDLNAERSERQAGLQQQDGRIRKIVSWMKSTREM